MAVAATCMLLATGARADEGMWVLKELNKQNIARMQELGLNVPFETLYSETNPCVANAVVIFGGGCSGITVSDEGLIFTNHHCGYGSIQKLSSVKHDYLKNGFVSQNFKEELPVEGLKVQYLRETVDLTDRIMPQLEGITDEFDRISTADSIGRAIADSVSKGDKFTNAEVLPFYNRNKYFLVVYDVFRDVRLVFAPPTSLGKFGGDTDNWMWTRHTCDFSVFRVYAGADNKPAEYSADNKPYHPRYVAEVSLQGYGEKDYAMTIGFPGSTDRYLSSWGVNQRIENSNKPRIEVRGLKQDIWRKAMQASDLFTVSREAPTSWASSSCVRSWGTCTPLSVDVPKRSARSSSALATRPGTSEKTRSDRDSLVRRRRWARARSMCLASVGFVSRTCMRSSCSRNSSEAGDTAVAVVDRGPGSKRVSSPMISPGPSTASRDSRPSLDVWPSFTLPSVTMYRRSPRSPSSKRVSPRRRVVWPIFCWRDTC